MSSKRKCNRALAAAVRTAAQAEGFGSLGTRQPSAWETTLRQHPLLPRQREYIDAPEFAVLGAGGFGSAKTVALCLNLVKRASHPLAREGLCRKELVTLKRTTLKTLLVGDGEMPPVLPVGSYYHRKSEQEIDLAPSGGGVIVYFGMGMDPESTKARGVLVTGLSVDQAEELEEADLVTLGPRVRVQVPGLARRFSLVSNTDAPECDLGRYFGIPDEAPPAGRRVITFYPRENPYLPPEHLAELEQLPELARLRHLESQWIAAAGAIYDMWRARYHVVERAGPWVRSCVSIDPAHGHRCGIELMRADADGWVHCEDEVWEAGLLNSAKLAYAREFAEAAGGLDRCPLVIDCEDAELIAEARAAGFTVRPADKRKGSVAAGIERMQGMLEASAKAEGRPDDAAVRRRIGRPGFTVGPRCSGFRKEVTTYQRRKGSEEPKKGNDDALDAARYGVMHLTRAEARPGLRVVRRA